MSVKENIQNILAELKGKVKLVAVTKTQPVSVINEAYYAGHRIFGENRSQELAAKREKLPDDIEWHMIGHLQTNKIKLIVPFVNLIQSVDSLHVLKEINKEAEKIDRIVDCLLQIKIAKEETKYGLDVAEAIGILQSPEFEKMDNVRIMGLMGMATLTEDENLIRSEFKHLHHNFGLLKEQFFRDKNYFKEISMGMSGDYKIAVEEGSTMVRIGSLIFGERN
jgi:PLP dependent protein